MWSKSIAIRIREDIIVTLLTRISNGPNEDDSLYSRLSALRTDPGESFRVIVKKVMKDFDKPDKIKEKRKRV